MHVAWCSAAVCTCTDWTTCLLHAW